MNVERLNHLIAILEKVRDTKQAFDINCWIYNPDLDDMEGLVGELPTCGTAACAGGYAALDPIFRAQGFRLISTDDFAPISSIEEYSKSALDDRGGEPEFDGETGYQAVSKFFDISPEQTEAVFSSNSYPVAIEERGAYSDHLATPDDVIGRIKELLA